MGLSAFSVLIFFYDSQSNAFFGLILVYNEYIVDFNYAFYMPDK
jgi:hypothetical protein